MTDFPHEFKETLVKVEDVTIVLGGKLILRDIDLEIKNVVRPGMSQGQVVGFLGRSGRGKTTLFRAMAGLLRPTRGRVLVTEKQVPVERGMVGVVPQYHTLFENRNVIGNLIVAGTVNGLKKAEARDKAMDLLERFQIADKVDDHPASLSGGQKQRVAIIQQLMCGHTYLLMDEPYASLDPVVKGETTDLIIEVSQMDERNTIIIVSHDIPEVLKAADTLWVLGFETDEHGKHMPGARVIETHNLIQRGLAWRKGVEKTPEFAEMVVHLNELFLKI
jgi:polar amino acid transport system ATP-binding protein/sulfate transport system ATP-binding protein